ncbi:MAG: uroporphyrinogen decarboxylase family protein [Clostridia bacterium]|nr:uroporphyrinogen decarboxylase family protein [Clostridia bacterium]
MNARERFRKTFEYSKLDRPFYWETPGIWAATAARWRNEGFDKPAGVRFPDFFGMDKIKWLPFKGGWTGNPYYPMFDETLLNDDGVNITYIDRFGITKKERKKNPETSMPQFLEFPVKYHDDFNQKILPRFNFEDEGRFPDNWNELVMDYSSRDYVLGMYVIGPFGFLRNLMGDEELMYALFDEPEFIHEMMQHWKSFYSGFINKVCRDIVPDFVMIWEDICYSNGPLVSPDVFNEFMAPYLKDVISVINDNNIKGIIVDTDGDCTKMLPIYLDCGANGFYPFEVQAGMDIVEIRKQYGNAFVIIGGLNKKLLANDIESIKAEIDKKVPFMLEKGGYIPMLDHTVPPDVPYSNFKFFIDYIRKIVK